MVLVVGVFSIMDLLSNYSAYSGRFVDSRLCIFEREVMKNLLIWIVVTIMLFVAGCANTLHGAGGLLKGVGADWQDAANQQLE